MSLINITEHDDKSVFIVQCIEPLTKMVFQFSDFSWLQSPIEKNKNLPFDRIWLQALINVSPEANMQQIGYEEFSLSGWEVDERYNFILTPTLANITVLKATNFNWSNEASKISTSFPILDKKIKNFQNKAIIYLRDGDFKEGVDYVKYL